MTQQIDTFLKSEEFVTMVRQMVEIGFNAGFKTMNLYGHDIIEGLNAKELAIQTALAKIVNK